MQSQMVKIKVHLSMEQREAYKIRIYRKQHNRKRKQNIHVKRSFSFVTPGFPTNKSK